MDPEQTVPPVSTEDQPKPPTYTTMSVQVKGRPPATGSDDQNDNGNDDGDGDNGGVSTVSVGTNPFTILVTTNETSSASVDFTYGQGSTTFAPADLSLYFTGAPTSGTVTSAAPNLSLPFSVLTTSIGTTFWLVASGCGITSAQQQFKRTV